jgi:DNA repair protein RecN (Recombination protein N)
VLEEMRIQGLGVIDDAVLQLGPGLTVVTGETGAGKTMVVAGLGLLFGGRADSGAVRTSAGTALVEGRLRVSPDGPVAERAQEAGGQLDDDALLLARSVTKEGRSRAYVGGRAVPVGVLAELAEHCLEVHGQSDQSRLLLPARQRDALDRYAGAAVLALRRRCAAGYAELRAAGAELAELRERARERAQEGDLLRFGLEEVAAVDPQPGEDVALAQEDERLANAEALRGAADRAHTVLLGDEDSAGGDVTADARSLVAAAGAELTAAARHDPELEGLAGRLREVGYLLADVAADLGAYATGVEADPARLAAVQDRRAALGRLVRKYGGGEQGADGSEVPAVLAWAEQAAHRLRTLEGADGRIDALTQRVGELQTELADVVAELSAARKDAATVFAAAVTAELAHLAMPQAELEVTVEQSEAPEPAAGLVVHGRRLAYGPHGVDDVQIMLRPHPGAPSRPLQKGASGGELSRVMLAVEVVFAGSDPVPTMVFDEVDAGVGGKAAVEVGRRLALLARTTQVVVVTHLPQVAAFADQHLVVRKASDGAVTRSGVTSLDDAGRLQELSRMLAGLEQSDTAQAHAAELLATAASAKRG